MLLIVILCLVSFFGLLAAIDYLVTKRVLTGTRRNWPVVVILLSVVTIFWTRVGEDHGMPETVQNVSMLLFGVLIIATLLVGLREWKAGVKPPEESGGGNSTSD